MMELRPQPFGPRLIPPNLVRLRIVQERLKERLIEDSRLREAYSGFGILKRSKDEKAKIVALTQGELDPDEFAELLEQVEKPESKRYGRSEFELIKTGVIKAASGQAAGGEGIQLHDGPAGTLGCMVVDDHKNEFFLSCNHVIANCNKASQNHPIIKPAYSGKPFGCLHDFEPLRFGVEPANVMDAAIGKPLEPGVLRPGFRSGKVFSKPSNSNPSFNAKVEKEGCSTGRTTGVLLIKNLSIMVPFSGGEAIFNEQYAVIGAPDGFWGKIAQPRFADGGDSGSVVASKSSVIGLLFAVSSEADLTFINPIANILKRFRVTIA